MQLYTTEHKNGFCANLIWGTVWQNIAFMRSLYDFQRFQKRGREVTECILLGTTFLYFKEQLTIDVENQIHFLCMCEVYIYLK